MAQNSRRMNHQQLMFTSLELKPIRIFIKGLQNAHSVAPRIYKKDPHTLTDAITEVEKLNAAQQLTMTTIPSSMVNMEWCF